MHPIPQKDRTMQVAKEYRAEELYRESIVFLDIRQYRKAIECINEAIRLDERPEYLMQRAMISYGDGNMDEIRKTSFLSLISKTDRKYPGFLPNNMSKLA